MAQLSVIIPVYNVGKYLSECLDSVINQTLKDIEIICVNDGSTDNSLEILEYYAKKDSRIKIINKKNGGYGQAMNIGVDKAIGEFIAILEPDDFIELDMYEKLYNKASELDVDFIKSDYYIFQEDLKQKVVCLDYQGNHYNRIINPKKELSVLHIGINTWTGIYKTNFIKNNKIRYNETPGARYQDQGFWFQTMIYANKIYILNEPYYHYRYFETNSTNNVNGFEWIQTEYDYIYNLLKEINVSKQILCEFYYFKFSNYLYNYHKLDSNLKLKNLPIMREIFMEHYQDNLIDLNIFNEYDRKMFELLMNDPKKFYKKIASKVSFVEKIFSLKNEKKHKVVRILGIKFKLKRKNHA